MKFRTSNVSLILNRLKSSGFSLQTVREIVSPKAKVYVLENKYMHIKAYVYHTVNSWVEVTYQRY